MNAGFPPPAPTDAAAGDGARDADALRAAAAALGAGADAAGARWLAGYFAGLADGLARHDGAGSAAIAPPLPVAYAASTRTLTIFHGTETGTARALAERIGTQMAQRRPDVRAMGTLRAKDVRALEDVLIICSTHGEGEPPQAAKPFFELIDGARAPRLEGVRFAAFALGDSSYEQFCAAGRQLDRRFAELGAERLLPCVDADIDFDAPFADWCAALADTLAPATPAPVTESAGKVAAVPRHDAVARRAPDRTRPFAATVIGVQRIVGRHSTKDTRHVELDVAGSGIVWSPGDALAVRPTNDPALVDAVMAATGVDEAARGVLAHEREITAVTPRFRDAWAALCGADLGALDCKTVQVIDVMRRWPVAGIDADALTAALRPLPHRLYSIASAQAAVGDEVHLTVAPVRFELDGIARGGVASTYLADRVAPGDTVPVWVQDNPLFRLPADDVPIIMIGAGTGVAPFRAFLQERAETGATGPNWLVFGERNFRSDFLYQAEWSAWRDEKLLTRIDVAFSRDRGGRVYVQDRLREAADAVRGWIADGAHVYLCGDAGGLARDVDAALTAIAGPEFVASDRYHRDVY